MQQGADNYTLILELDIQNLDQKIAEFIDLHAKKSPLESDLLAEKYIHRNRKINLREQSKLHKCSMKKVNQAMEAGERKLYSHLLSYL
ncbi:MAG: hypothetical protein Q4A72_01275 [Bacillota bacterium]|nr:hypothetical protein [Bacillota bacterium]